MQPIFYNPCEECKHKDQPYGERMYSYCDVCALMVQKRKWERLVKRIMKFLSDKDD